MKASILEHCVSTPALRHAYHGVNDKIYCYEFNAKKRSDFQFSTVYYSQDTWRDIVSLASEEL